MQARKLPAIRGWNWIVEGFHLFRTNPALLTFLVFGYWLTLVFLNLMPLIGMVVAPLCVPALSVGVMNGCRALERESGNGFGLLFSGFRKNGSVLLILGAAYLAGTLAVFAVSALFDGGALFAIMMAGEPPPEDLLQSDQLMLALQVALILMVPLLMAFWFAPLLAAWEGMSPM
ncbi:MAG: BPSS1780 family membrane protein, partial [Prosthecobacter sp.]|nr:BPSS1780 family membrane protein [Prosthecobacter sp.]